MVYIVTSGQYSDYSIDSVFETRELAAAYIELRQKSAQWYDGSIEEWPLIGGEGQMEEVRLVELRWYPDDEAKRVRFYTTPRFAAEVTNEYHWADPLSRWDGRSFVKVVLMVNPNYPDDWWVERATKGAQDIWAIGEYVRVKYGTRSTT